MKQVFIVLGWLLCVVLGSAQAQELEQLKLNLEKLVQLKLMLARAKEGYQILQKGYNGVRDAAKGNFDLHKKQLDLLLVVSDNVRASSAIQKSLNNYGRMEQEARDWMQRSRLLGLFTSKEMEEMNQDFLLVVAQGKDDKETLSLVLSDGMLRMSDAERLSLIEMLSSNSDQYLMIVRQKVKAQTGIAVARAQVNKDRDAIRRLYGL